MSRHWHASNKWIALSALARPKGHKNVKSAIGHFPQIQKDIWITAIQLAALSMILQYLNEFSVNHFIFI